MEASSDKPEGSDMIPLSLMSKFCDKFCDKLSGNCTDEQNCDKLDKSLFSDVFSYNSTSYSSYRPKRREHSSNAIISYGCDSVNCADFGEPFAQQLVIKRKIPLSRHIKPEKLSKYMSEDVTSEVDLNETCTGYGLDTDVKSANSFIKKRLKSYLPALKRHVQRGDWAHLDEFPSLGKLALDIEGPSSTTEFIHNSYKCTSHWDSQQAYLISSTPTIMVFYGIISKPSCINVQRLKKLFAHVGVAPLPLQNMLNERKHLYLQDGTGRVQLNDLCGKLSYDQVISGIPVGIIGRVSRTKLNVEDVVFATPCSPEWPIPTDSNIEMVFVSGLYFGSEDSNSLSLDLLHDYLMGLVGSANEQQVIASRVRLFILGNSISKPNEKSGLENVTRKSSINMGKLDDFLEPLVKIMEVFIVPGESDLTFSPGLPQPPIPANVFPQCGMKEALKRLPNPAKVQVSAFTSDEDTTPKSNAFEECSLMMDSSFAELLRGDVDFIDMVLQSGRNVKHIMDYCDIPSPIEMVGNLLKWGHLYPISCDNDSISTVAENLFTVKGAAPHFAMIGNVSEFSSTEFNGTKIVGVPSFLKTNTAVVVTKNLDVIPLSFKLL